MFSRFVGRSGAKAISTKELILQSAVEIIVESGFSTFSAASVARRAGLSTGALFANFKSRAELVGEMCRYLFDKLEKEFVNVGIDKQSSPEDKVELLIDAVFSVYSDERMKSSLELYGACRTDNELRKILASINNERSPHHVALAEAIIGAPQISSEQIEEFVHLVIFAVQGMALDFLAGANPRVEEMLHNYLVRLGREIVRSTP